MYTKHLYKSRTFQVYILHSRYDLDHSVIPIVQSSFCTMVNFFSRTVDIHLIFCNGRSTYFLLGYIFWKFGLQHVWDFVFFFLNLLLLLGLSRASTTLMWPATRSLTGLTIQSRTIGRIIRILFVFRSECQVFLSSTLYLFLFRV